jgi:uncharacterized protein (TIGR02453 family)
MKKNSPAFNGFRPELFAFLAELSDNNNRQWFQQNKQRYETVVLEPALAFVQAMEQPLHKLSPMITAVAKRMGGSIMRIYRDTRFSADKTPYKTNLGIQFRHQLGKDVHAPGMYVHLACDECFLGAGMWMPPAEPLLAVRTAISECPTQWQKVRREKKFVKRYQLESESLKSVPRGFDKQHPLIDDIKLKSFAALSKISKRELCSSQCVEVVVSAFADARPLMRFLCKALDIPF